MLNEQVECMAGDVRLGAPALLGMQMHQLKSNPQEKGNFKKL